jgi:hypothetical protein
VISQEVSLVPPTIMLDHTFSAERENESSCSRLLPCFEF